MARMPGAIWRPLTTDKSRWRLVPLRVNLHVAVSEAASLFGYFNGARSRPDSHFYVRRDGTIEQYVDTALVAYADLEGNGSTISVETQGGVTATQTQPWTTAQLESLARIYAWAIKTHNIARRIADDSRPGKSSHGLSWHRLGCDGNFPGRPLHGRVAGGRKYSRAFGKVCPGDAKIRQIPTIYSRAVALLDGAAPTPERTWFDMATESQLRKIIREEVPSLPWSYVHGSEDYNMGFLLRRAYHQQAAVLGNQAGLLKAIEQLATGGPIDLDAIRAAAEQGVADALASVEADVTITIGKD